MEEIICLYLYDDIVPPAAGTLKTKKDVLALAKTTRQDVEIDKNWFMTKGGGRFMHIARFGVVRNFLAKKDHVYKTSLPVPPKGQMSVYDTNRIFNAYNVLGPRRRFGLKQYEYDLNSNDFTDRCEVFGSSKFAINAGAQFIIRDDGTRETHSIWVEPVKDDYDYESSSWEAKVSNTLTESVIDPGKLAGKLLSSLSEMFMPYTIFRGWICPCLKTKTTDSKHYKLLRLHRHLNSLNFT